MCSLPAAYREKRFANRLFLILTTGIFLLPAMTAFGGTLTGNIRDKESFSAVPGAEVSFQAIYPTVGGGSTVTDINGNYSIFLPSGYYLMQVRKAGYRTYSLSYVDATGVANTYNVFLEPLSTPSYGSLRVVIEPAAARAAGAAWRRAGTSEWLTSGYLEENVAAISTMVEFRDIAGWSRPGLKPVTIQENETVTVSGTYEQRFGSLSVTLVPAAAIAAGARWRRVGTTTWRESGFVEHNLPGGPCEIEFKPVTGWARPGNATPVIAYDETATGSYAYRSPGSITVNLNPSLAVADGARWRRKGTEAWYSSGQTEPGVPVWEFEIEYAEVDGWARPADTSVALGGGEAFTHTTEYRRPGLLTVHLWPAKANAYGRWRFRGEDAWRDSGETIANCPVWDPTLEFREVSEYITPASRAIEVSEGSQAMNVVYERDGFIVKRAGTFSAGSRDSLCVYKDRLWSIHNRKIYASTDGMDWDLIVENPGSPATGFNTRGWAHVFQGELWWIGQSSFRPGDNGNTSWHSTDGITWTKAVGTSKFENRNDFAGAVFDGRQWVVAGVASNDLPFWDAWSSTDGTEWTENTLYSPYLAKHAHSLVAFNNKLWAIGGYSIHYSSVAFGVACSDDGVTWQLVSANPPFGHRLGMQCAILGDRLLVIGGHTITSNSTIPHADVWSTSDGIEWRKETLSSPMIGRMWFGAAAFRDRVVIVGGRRGSTPEDTIEHLIPAGSIEKGGLQVHIEPLRAAQQGAGWRREDAPYRYLETGLTEYGVLPDTYRVEFASLPGWEAPAPFEVQVHSSEVTEATVPYSRQTGTVSVQVTPDAASWSFTDGDGVVHQGTGDAVRTGIPTGEIVLNWLPFPGYLEPLPNPHRVTLVSGGDITFSGLYSPAMTPTPTPTIIPTPSPSPTPVCALPGDGNCDGIVSALELSQTISGFRGTGSVPASADSNGDGIVSALELSRVISAYRNALAAPKPSFAEIPGKRP